MQPDDLLLEVQDLLFDQGDDAVLRQSVGVSLRRMARELPIFPSIAQIATTWWVGTWVEGSNTSVEITADVLAGVSTPLGGSFGDGLLLGFNGMLDTLTLTISVPQIGGDNTYEYTYWNGSAWLPLPTTSTPTWSSATAQTLAFDIPEDWRQEIPPGITFTNTLSTNRFFVRVRYLGSTTFSQAPALAGMTAYPFIYPLSDEVVRLLCAVYYPAQLEHTQVEQSLDFWDTTWRTLAGTPALVTQEIMQPTRIRLIPKPTVLGTEGLPLFSGSPLATSGPNNIVLLQLVTPDITLLPVWAEGLLCLDLVAEEARRETDAQDLPLANAMGQLRSGLMTILRELWEEYGLEIESGPTQHITGTHYHG